MKKIIFSLSLFAIAALTHAQCGKNITFSSAKTEYLDVDGKVMEIKSTPIKIELTQTHIVVRPDGNENDVTEGDIKETKCEWKELYKDGKATFKSLLAKTNGETSDAVFTLEAKDGKLVLTVSIERMGGRKMRLLIDSYKEGV